MFLIESIRMRYTFLLVEPSLVGRDCESNTFQWLLSWLVERDRSNYEFRLEWRDAPPEGLDSVTYENPTFQRAIISSGWHKRHSPKSKYQPFRIGDHSHILRVIETNLKPPPQTNKAIAMKPKNQWQAKQIMVL